MMKVNPKIGAVLVLLAGVAVLISYAGIGAQAQTAPRFKYDPDWPKPLPNKWKMGGVTGLAVDKDDNVWVLNRPNDLTCPSRFKRSRILRWPTAASMRRR